MLRAVPKAIEMEGGLRGGETIGEGGIELELVGGVDTILHW